MNNWSREKVSSFAKVVGGGTPSRKKEDEYFGGNIPWLSPRDLSDHSSRFVSKGAENITEEGLNNSSAKLLPKDAILFSSRATIGNVAIAKNPITTSQGFRSLVCKKEKAIPSFVYYALQYYTPQIEQIASGATYKEISGSALADFEIDLPPIGTQQKIASILSAFDDLIENNSRRIEILEEMARRIYREWFVHFRYPGYEDEQQIKSGTELGEIPEGWEVKNVIDLYDTSAGGTPSRKKDEYFNGNIPWVKTKELSDSFIQESEEKITKLGLENSSAKLFPENSVLVAMYGATVGQLGILDMEAATNQACCAVMEKEEPFDYSYIFFSFLEYRNKLIGLKQGAAQQNINQGIIKEFKVLKPPTDILKRFQDKLYPLLDQIRVLKKKNDRLKETRDLLLPKLISGEIEHV